MAQVWGALLFISTACGSLTQDKITQTPSIISAKAGDDVHLTCLHHQAIQSGVFWTRQAFGERLVSIASYYTSTTTYQNDFKSARFEAKGGHNSFNLTISQTQTTDSATYYCGTVVYADVTFGEGTVLFVRGEDSSRHAVIEQLDSVSVPSGGNVTLTCSVHSGSCAEEPRVFWFRLASGESHQGVVYSHGDRCVCDPCPEDTTHTHSCVHQLPRRNLSHSDAHTYYCAVAACGHIVFGNGTRVHVQDDRPEPIMVLLIVSSLATVLLMSLLVNVAFCLRVKKSQSASHSGVSLCNTSQTLVPVSEASSAGRGQDGDGVSYATVQLIAGQRDTQRRETHKLYTHTLYSPIRYQDKS
ncbi:uncharacterized protein LOC105892686 isoform X2 [Clupea harengus]|uniref:Uncharacterized protein LOC105892686 isoform X2 n=1 Tax=Clupea harengus TaxID=7950 RepID=A0A8M1KUN0_CLUHA|nr:uncharacterized protein LOC105892686 isoform X2 [Clupea harengus]